MTMKKYPFTILLSASVPADKRSEKYQEKYTRIKNAQIQIEEAVIGLSRNIFQARGKIVFGGHPSISPLVAMVATEFKIKKGIENFERNEISEKPINIYQSKAYENVIPKETTGLYSMGYSEIIWTEAVEGEQFNYRINNIPQCEKSLEQMRTQMMEGDVDALVCIGGMEGVEKEFALFRELHPNKPIYVLKTTGGASKLLADEFPEDDMVNVIDSIDYPEFNKKSDVDYIPEKFDIIPYSFITSLIIKDLKEKMG